LTTRPPDEAPPPPPPDEAPPPPPPGAEGGVCPRCGTPYEPFQEYCLECGLRLPISRGVIPVLATAWRRRVSWYPGDWIWPVLGLLLIAALAAAVAILATTGNESATKTRAETGVAVPPGTGTQPPPPVETGTGTGPGPTESVPTTAPTAPQPQPPPPSNQLVAWPQGQNGWTIVLASIPQTAGRSAAASAGRKALAAGLPDVGVINSSEFSSLHSGYFVVFSGIYDSQSEAKSNVSDAKATYPAAYVRQITQ
jgi:hypothetical protein